MPFDPRLRVLIASFLEPAFVERIRAVDPRLAVTYRADLLGHPRYPGDHTAPMMRSAAQDEEWDALVAEAEVMFDAYRPRSDDLPRRAPRLQWIQFSSSGIVHLVEAMGLAESAIVMTTAAGIHAIPLAEFVLFAMLYFAKRLPRVLADQRGRHWERFAVETLPGKTLGVVGLGRVGREVARLARAAGLRVVATARTAGRPGVTRLPDRLEDAPGGVADVLLPPSALHALLAQSDYLALTVPLTPETIGLIGAAELGHVKPGAVLINVARGLVVDESALIEALRRGHLSGAALDVFAVEPLPSDSPLWNMPNVLVTPHSMSTAVDENAVVTELFCDNLRRHLAGQPLLNLFDRARGY